MVSWSPAAHRNTAHTKLELFLNTPDNCLYKIKINIVGPQADIMVRIITDNIIIKPGKGFVTYFTLQPESRSNTHLHLSHSPGGRGCNYEEDGLKAAILA